MKILKELKIVACFLIALSLIFLTEKPVTADDTIVLAYNGNPEELAAWKFVHLVTEEIFRELNIKMKYEVLPAKRAGFSADQGKYDGDNARVYEYNKKFTNLLRVEEPIYTQVLAAYSNNKKITLSGWDSLRGKDYLVEYLRGVIFVEMKLSSILPAHKLSAISSRKQGLKKLAKGRTDVFIDVEGLITSLLNKDEFKNSGIQNVGVMEKTPLYLYMHKKHGALIPKLEKTLKGIKTDGLYEKYHQQAFGVKK